MEITFLLIFVALVFTYTNGFHDTANAIATVVGTKVLTPRQAILLAAATNLLGAFFGEAVAKTISAGLVDAQYAVPAVVTCGLIGSIVWNLLTWWLGLPSSSSHALVGGLCGAALAAAHGNFKALIWAQAAGKHWWEGKGILYKVIIPMFTSPLLGFFGGMLFMSLLYIVLRRWRPVTVNQVFGKLQLCSSAYMGFGHGMNDATKCMGIITIALVAATSAGHFDHLPGWLGFLKVTVPADIKSHAIPRWITVMCALTMAAGTAAGGWRIIRTLGHRLVKLQPVHGFAAETTGATVLAITGTLGMPVSTTHAITTSIMGVGCAKRFSALKLKVVERILWAWVLTLPATGGLAYLIVSLCQQLGWIK